MKKIEVKNGEKKRLIELFKVSYLTVRRALNFEVNTDLAQRIRQNALENGGRVLEERENINL